VSIRADHEALFARAERLEDAPSVGVGDGAPVVVLREDARAFDRRAGRGIDYADRRGPGRSA
jgi:hypothetical protein